jgi:hypothetical protein
MFGFRAHASALASCALIWQIVALIFVPAAACCQTSSRPASGGMANCPMQHSAKAPDCPMHAHAAAEHDCHCPNLGCAETDQGFLALFGPIGVVPATASTFALQRSGDSVSGVPAFSLNLAPVPAAPPPRI